ncbi:MAG: SLBB domain-containing protein [Verrucomicrobia bacterium]|nr:SLBB domain-containing protein [Verrucomicrobiota bacterium]
MNTRLIPRAGVAGLILLFAAVPARAEDDASAKVSLSAVSNPGKRAKWQERLTLGSGDTLDFSLLEAPDLARKGVVVGPDGRVTFLQAENIMAAGLTIDELRAKFDEQLSKYYRSPRTIITPVAYNSKRYFVLGTVANKGVFPLNRPTTVIEAIAQAGGLEIGLFERSTVELADLGRSFLIRNGERLAVDFEKLFQRGDLSQNIAIEPDDYMYFASAEANQIYVLGEVANPGVLAFAQRATVMSALAARGGFTDKAYKSRVLVVRGSLDKPETFVIDTTDILAAKKPDFKLQPKDIVYVGPNRWLLAVDLLDVAVKAFITSMTVQAINQNIGPWITTPIIK